MELSFQKTPPQPRNFSAASSRSVGLKDINQGETQPLSGRLGNAAGVRGSPKGPRNPRGLSEQTYRQMKSIFAPTVTSASGKPTDRLPQIQTGEFLFHD